MVADDCGQLFSLDSGGMILRRLIFLGQICSLSYVQSISLGPPSSRKASQPLCDLAMAKDEVKARLAPIPVFTVANPKNEFVLVAGEVSMLLACNTWAHSYTPSASEQLNVLALVHRITLSWGSSSSSARMLKPS